MTPRQMKIFVEVYDCLNMTRAAENLNMTQPAVTKAIKEIEELYGIRLFERLNKALYPTQQAEEIYFQVRSLTSAFDNLEKNLAHGDRSRTIRLGATSTLATYMLPKLAAHLRETRPELEVRVFVENVAAIEQMLSRNTIDLAYIEGMVFGRDLDFRDIFDDRLAAVCSPSSGIPKEISLQELTAYPVLLTEKGSITRRYVDSVFTSRNLRINSTWESESYHAIINAVHEDMGISFLPEKLVAKPVSGGWLRKIFVTDADFGMTDHVVWHKDKYLSPLMKSLIDFDYRDFFKDTGYGA